MRRVRTMSVAPVGLLLACSVLTGCGASDDPSKAGSNVEDGDGGTTPTPTPDAMTTPPPTGTTDHCPVNTGYNGDDACLPMPDPSEGIQIHIGPDFDDPASVQPFLMMPGDESSQCWSFHTPNSSAIYYQTSELSGRPGTHHIINTMYTTDHADSTAFTACRDGGAGLTPEILANLPGASQARMPRRTVAPENAGIASEVPAGTAAQADMHYFNVTDEPIVREFWMNLYTVPESQVTETPLQIRGMGGFSWTSAPIPPNSHDVYPYSCPIPGDGRITQLLGHTHSHGVRETAWIRRGSGERLQVFEQYDYLEPQIFQYDTITQNPAFSTNSPGAFTGTLEVHAGDVLEWECEVNNDSAVALRYINDVETGEMCNIWGQTVGPLINCLRP